MSRIVLSLVAVALLITSVSVLAESQVVNGERCLDPERSYPWMAELLRQGSAKPFCSGVLVHKRWVLTAGHCVKMAVPRRDVAVFPGDRTYLIVGEVRHEQGDIGLLKLDKDSASGTPGVGPAPSPPASATIAGYGEDEDYKSGTLNCGEVKIVSEDVCATIKLVGPMLCAAHANTNVCFGDSGGPLLVQRQLVGVAASVDPHGQCSQSSSGLRIGSFVRVYDYLSWIRAQVSGG